MPSFGQLFVSIGANIEGISKGFDDTEKSIKGFARRLDGLGRNFQDLGTRLSLGVTAPLAALGTVGVAAFSKFDAAMTESLAIMGDVSEGLRQEMATAAREMAKRTTFSAEQAAQSFFFLASAGLDARASIEALPAVAQFAQAGMFDMARATDLLTDAQSALGLTIRNDAVANMENMVRVSDVLVKANTLANASVEQFSEALTNKAGAALRALGKDVEEGVAVLAAFADQGIKGEEAGTQLGIVLRDLQTQAIANRDNFTALGVQVFDNAGEMRNLGDIIANLENVMGGMSDEQKRVTLGMLGFSDRSVAATQVLLGTSDAIKQYEAGLRVAAGTTENIANKQLTSFSAQLSLVKSRLEDSAITIGEALVPVIRNLGTILEPVLGFVESAVKWFGQLPSGVQTTAIAIAGLAAAAGPVIFALGTVASAASSLVTLFAAGGPLAGAFAGFGGILAAVTGPVGIAVAAIAGIGIALYAFRDDIANSRIGEIWSETWQNVTDSLSQAFDGLTTALSNFTAAFVARWEEGLFGLRPVIEGVWSGIGSIFAGALETISAIVGGGLEIVAGIVNTFAQLLSGNFEGAWEAAKGVFRAALDTIVEIVGAQIGAILGIIDGFSSALGKSLKLQETFDKEVDGVLKALDRQSTGMKGAEKSVKKLGGEVKKTGDVVAKLPTKFKLAEKAVKSFDKQVDEAIKSLEKQAKQEKVAAVAAQEYAAKHDDARRGIQRLRFDIEKTTREIEESTRAQQNLARAISDDVVPSIDRATRASIGLVVAATNTQTTIAGTEQGFYSLAEAIAGFGIKSQSIANNELAQLRNQLEVIRKQAAEGNPDALRALKQAEKEYADAVKAAGGPVEATGIWGDALKQVSTVITDFGKSVAQDLGQHIKTGIGIIDSMTESLLRLVSEKVFGAVLKHFQSLKDFIPSLSNVKDLLKDIGAALGIGSSVASTAGTVAGTAGTAAGSAAGAAGQAAGTVGGVAGSVGGAGGAAGAATTGALATASAVTGIVTGIVSAVTGVIGVFQNARQETTLNAIEENTRRGTQYLGDRGDGGITTSNLKILELTGYNTASLDDIKGTLWDVRGILQGFATTGIMVAGLSLSPQASAASIATFEPAEFASAVSRGVDLSQLRTEFEAAQRTATNQLDELQQQSAQLEAIQDAIEDQGPTVVVNIQNAFAGSPQEFARLVSREIEKQLRTSTKGLR